MLTGTYDAGFRTALMAKDLRCTSTMVGEAGTAGDRRAHGRRDVWQDADAALPGSDFTQIWQHVAGPVASWRPGGGGLWRGAERGAAGARAMITP